MFKPVRLTSTRSDSTPNYWRMTLNLGLKAVLLAGICWVFYYQVIHRQDIDQISKAFYDALSSSSKWWLALAIILVPFNWLFETFKWKSLLDNFRLLDFRDLYKAVLAGITVSLFTPNRIGEYAGRVLFLPADLRWRGTMATVGGSFAQLIVLIGIGLLALGLFSLNVLNLNGWLILGAALLSSLMLFMLFLCYFNLDLADRLLNRLPKWELLLKARKPISYLGQFSTSSLQYSVLYAGIRYGIYSLQYYLVATFFGISVDPIEAFMVIGSIYLLQTSIPLPPIWSLLVRGQVALYFWGFFCNVPILILAATFAVWVINLILPALIGMVFLMFLNISETLGYETKKD